MLETISGKDILKNSGPPLFLYFGTPPTVCQFAILLPNSARSIFGKGDTGVSMHLIDAVSEAAIK